jgi:radical SAM protein with 4Fe4S-binding SPASM domain
MVEKFVSSIPLEKFDLWEKTKAKRKLLSIDFEITARCNNDCRHCYINLPAGDKAAKAKELSIEEIEDMIEQALPLGTIWCLITGGEPLLRKDFADIYLLLKEKGILVSVFTNATLIKEDHIQMFKKHPPKNIEVSVYGVSKETYEKITRKPGSFEAFSRGLNLLLENGIKVRLKAMALRSNVHELSEMGRFCRERTKDYYRFDPFLHMRYDGNQYRNSEIRAERLDPEEIVALEQSDPERFQALKKSCEDIFLSEKPSNSCPHLLRCGAGRESLVISYDGYARLCYSLWHPDCIYDLRKGSLDDAFFNFVPEVRNIQSHRKDFMEQCGACSLINLCMWCPANAHLEAGKLDEPVDYFCRIAHARADMLQKK